MVSWVRHRDIHLLTVGRYTYTGDQRFRSINQPPSEDWTLQIKYPQIRDSGIYECQISTTPHISQYIHLQVVGKSNLTTLYHHRDTRALCYAAMYDILFIITLSPIPMVRSFNNMVDKIWLYEI
ncbi:PREDICTED: uncharacterized protein LOC107166174 [Diuraphis noxia]|uniref:uncharacterized protein LOC107166174 n=1 Tax=Diuraphis noxia TaxID=143948 RepID=UPI000763B1AB|nr:PREDICTED: uncharacterized protein LOC107166174 [Diuraphis noxia]